MVLYHVWWFLPTQGWVYQGQLNASDIQGRISFNLDPRNGAGTSFVPALTPQGWWLTPIL